jgi:hypothetical protein
VKEIHSWKTWYLDNCRIREEENTEKASIQPCNELRIGPSESEGLTTLLEATILFFKQRSGHRQAQLPRARVELMGERGQKGKAVVKN